MTWLHFAIIQESCKLIQALWKKVRIFLKKLGVKLPYDPEIYYWVYNLRKP